MWGGGGRGTVMIFLLGMKSKNYLPSNSGPSSDLGHFILIICQTKENFVTFMKKVQVKFLGYIHSKELAWGTRHPASGAHEGKNINLSIPRVIDGLQLHQ